MVIKKIAWKRPKFSFLVNYIASGGTIDTENFIFHNTSTFHVTGVIHDFEENDTYLNVRSNSNRVLHEIMSFHVRSRPYLTTAKIKDLARKYIALRAKNNVVFAAIHHDKDHLHCHFAISPSEVLSSEVTHLDNTKYRQVRRELERYQQEKYPELEDSIVFLSREKNKDKVILNDKVYQMERRGKASEKSAVIAAIESAFTQADSLDDFYDTISQEGYEIYHYRGKPKGMLIGKKKYAFNSHGLDKARRQRLLNHENSLIQQRRRELSTIRDEQAKSNYLEHTR